MAAGTQQRSPGIFQFPSFHRDRLSCGFTLIELILVFTVIGILLVASIPRFQQTQERLRVEQSAFDLTQLLRYAHALAAAQGNEIVWVWNASARRARLLALTVGDDGRVSSQWLEGRAASSAALEEGASLSTQHQETPLGCPRDVPTDAQCIRFFPDGTSESAALILSLHERSYTVTIDGTTSQILLKTGPAAR